MGKNGSLGLGIESNFNQLLVHYGVKLILGSGSVIFYCYSVCIKEQRGELGQHFIPTVDTSGREPFSCGSVCQRSTFLNTYKENKVFHDPCRHCVDYVYCTMFGRDILALYMG